jgi:hypothetical protein
MSALEITFNTDDPKLRPLLADVGRMPRGPERLRVEAGLCQWWANRCLETAGAIESSRRTDATKTARAKATRAANKTAASNRVDGREATNG